MVTIQRQATIGQLVAASPARAGLFEKLGIDYCCGGKQPIEDACRAKGLDPDTVLRMLEAVDAAAGAHANTAPDPAAMTLTDLCQHIEQTHHAYLRSELPRLFELTRRVATRHGRRNPKLVELHRAFAAFQEELVEHMRKEEWIVFPMIRALEGSGEKPQCHCSTLPNPIRKMHADHDAAGSALATFNALTDGYRVPEDACNSYRIMLESLARLEQDMHRHVYKENNVLFPRALELESRQPRAEGGV